MSQRTMDLYKVAKMYFLSIVRLERALNGPKTANFEILMLVSFYCGFSTRHWKKNWVDNLFPRGCCLVKNFPIGAKITFFLAILSRKPNLYGIEPK